MHFVNLLNFYYPFSIFILFVFKFLLKLDNWCDYFYYFFYKISWKNDSRNVFDFIM